MADRVELVAAAQWQKAHPKGDWGAATDTVRSLYRQRAAGLVHAIERHPDRDPAAIARSYAPSSSPAGHGVGYDSFSETARESLLRRVQTAVGVLG